MKTACLFLLLCLGSLAARAQESPQPFGAEFPKLDSLAVGEWWKTPQPKQNPPPPMDVPRDQVVAFALYTHEREVLKLTAQLYPLKPGEPKEARLELFRRGKWVEAARASVLYPGWSAHFRVESWDATKDARYRVRHGATAMFEGNIRRDPKDKNEIVVAVMSCNSSRTTGLRLEMIENLKAQNPDLLFFAGDQTYRHTEHTAGWIEFGLQFRDVMRDRPTISIPDGHDVGHPHLWGENGKRWWHPPDEQAGPNPVKGSPLPWTGDYLDGMGNKISMLAYANPPDVQDERQRGDGYGLARFHKKKRTVIFECWPRFASVRDGNQAQFPGWPVTVNMDDNDGRKPAGWLPELIVSGAKNPVVQVIDESSGEVLYTVRIAGTRFRPPVYGAGPFTLKVGRDTPDGSAQRALTPGPQKNSRTLRVKIP